MRFKVMVGALAFALVGTPGAAAAQADGGWWEWALREVARNGTAEVAREAARDTRRDPEARSGGSIADVILGRRGESERGRASDRGRRGESERGRASDRGRGAEESARQGPPFCRNGQGHPVHGMEWCREKGFGTNAGGLIWRDGGWGDVVIRAPRDTDRRGGVIDQGGLLDVLGEVIFGRVDAERSRLGAGEPLTGRWLRPRGATTVLQIRSGGIPVAELTDADGDGRVDVVLVPRR